MESMEPFELEWTGGPAAHHFRKARPEIDDLPWDTLDPRAYPPELVAAVRGSWTELAINEYRAFAFFAEVLHALALARAPLDLLGMASDFFRASHPDSSLQMAFYTLVPFYLLAIGLFLLLARSIRRQPAREKQL